MSHDFFAKESFKLSIVMKNRMESFYKHNKHYAISQCSDNLYPQTKSTHEENQQHVEGDYFFRRLHIQV